MFSLESIIIVLAFECVLLVFENERPSGMLV